MNREQFEEWFNKKYFISNEDGSHTREMMFNAWLAGRKSMRDYAASACGNMPENAHPDACAEAILRLEP